jgi:parvulin-like peptidyl-prolyl isomerase
MKRHIVAATAALCFALPLAAQDAPLPEADAPLQVQEITPDAAPAAPEDGQPVAPPPADPKPERIIARVGDFTITEAEFAHDVMMRWAATAGQQARSQPPSEEFRTRTLREMIDARVLRILAKNSGIEVTQEEVLEQFENGRKRLPNDAAFRAYLDQLGVTPEGLMDEIRASIQVDKYRERETAGVEVTEEEVKEAYEKAREDGQTRRNSPTADVGHILLMPPADTEDAWEATRARMEAVRQRIVDGESFEDVARDVSQDTVSARRGGLYREAVPGLVGKEFTDKMMELPLNELSEPFRSSLGWHLLKVYARYEPGEVTYEQLAPVLRERIEAAKKQMEIAQRIADARKIIRIEILPEER